MSLTNLLRFKILFQFKTFWLLIKLEIIQFSYSSNLYINVRLLDPHRLKYKTDWIEKVNNTFENKVILIHFYKLFYDTHLKPFKVQKTFLNVLTKLMKADLKGAIKYQLFSEISDKGEFDEE